MVVDQKNGGRGIANRRSKDLARCNETSIQGPNRDLMMPDRLELGVERYDVELLLSAIERQTGKLNLAVLDGFGGGVDSGWNDPFFG